jgi:predicted RNase H-like HicB family nuclease
MVLSWSEPDQLWVVDVPELPGCFADGPTPEEAVHQAQVVIGEWIATASKYGRPVPEPVDMSARV